MFRNMQLATRMMTSFLIVGIIPFGILAWVSLWKASTSLSEAEYNKLKALRDVKKGQITEYYYDKLNDLTVLADNPHTVTAAKELEKASEEAKSRGVNGRQLLVDAKFMKVYSTIVSQFLLE